MMKTMESKLTIIKEYRDEKTNRLYVECLCECGNTTCSRKDYVFNGKKISCGCVKIDRIREVNKKGEGVSAFNSFLSHYKASAVKRELNFNLTEVEFKNIISDNCFYCGTVPISKTFNKSQSPLFANGIDRIDNKVGYEPANCRSCCTICNIMKSTLTEQEFYNHIKKIMENRNVK